MSKDAASRPETGHRPEATRIRLREGSHNEYLADAVLGSIDGCVTTFAVVAGSYGGGLPPRVAIILGLANLFADGFSMGASNYLGAKSQSDHLERVRGPEPQGHGPVPEDQRREVRRIFAARGYEGELLDNLVDAVTRDARRWVDGMVAEELGGRSNGRRPFFAGLTTFIAFVLVGMIPLLPFLMTGVRMPQAFLASAVLTGLAFLAVGLVKGMVVRQSVLRSGVETVLIGGAAAALAYFVGSWLRQVYGVG